MQTAISSDQIQVLQTKVTTIDNQALHQACNKWQYKERRCLVLVLIHLAEVERRKLHLDFGYMHLSNYCQSYLGLSEGETWVRVSVARASLRFPELLQALAVGELSLTVAGMIAGVISDENKSDLLQSCSGKNKQQVREILAPEVPASQQRATMRPIRVVERRSKIRNNETSEEDLFSKQPSSDSQKSSPVSADIETEVISSALVHKIACTISDDTKAKLWRLAELLGISDPLGSLDLLINNAAELALIRKDPAKHNKQTNGSAQQNQTPIEHFAMHPEDSLTTAKSVTAMPTPEIQTKTKTAKNYIAKEPRKSRYIPLPTKRTLLARARYRCEYISPDGVRCVQRTHLQVDHIHSYSRGGSNEMGNLQILCGGHNRRKFEKDSCSPSERWKQRIHTP